MKKRQRKFNDMKSTLCPNCRRGVFKQSQNDQLVECSVCDYETQRYEKKTAQSNMDDEEDES